MHVLKKKEEGAFLDPICLNKNVPKLCPSWSNISNQFQAKPKIRSKTGIESAACNYEIFEFSKIWSENPRVGSSILSLGTINKKAPEIYLWSFFIYGGNGDIKRFILALTKAVV
jgi:hypothetical protein